jgi:hypothetical protein
MPTWVIVLIIGIQLSIDAVIVRALLGSASHSFNAISDRYPARERLPDAVFRRFQSVRIGAIGIGGCVHIAIDERFIHVDPAWLMRVAGMRPASVPWESIQVVKTTKRWAKVSIGTTTITGPTWCFGLAPGADAEASDQKPSISGAGGTFT